MSLVAVCLVDPVATYSLSAEGKQILIGTLTRAIVFSVAVVYTLCQMQEARFQPQEQPAKSQKPNEPGGAQLKLQARGSGANAKREELSKMFAQKVRELSENQTRGGATQRTGARRAKQE